MQHSEERTDPPRRDRRYMDVENELDPLGCLMVAFRTAGCLMLLTIGKALAIVAVIVIGLMWYSC